MSGVFAPYAVTLGAGGPVAGLMAANIVDVCQSWQLQPAPWRALAGAVLPLLVLLLLGTLPWVDNWAQLGGLVFGALASMVFLPYITFGRWDKARKRCLLVLSLPAMAALLLVLALLFFSVQRAVTCGRFCDYVECVPYTATLCATAGSP